MIFGKGLRAVLLAGSIACIAAGPADSSGLRPALPLFQAGPTLVAHWPMDTGTTNTPDVVGPNTLTFAATPTASVGVYGGAFTMNPNDYMTAPDNASLQFGTGSFSVALWVRQTTNATQMRLFNKWDGPGGQGWMMDLNLTTPGNIRMIIDSSSVLPTVAAERLDHNVAAGVGTGVWTHVAATVNRTSREVRIYKDGVQVGATGAIPAAMDGLSVDNNMSLGLGTIANQVGLYLDSAVDDVRIYSGALTAAQMNAVYSNGNVAIGVGNVGPVVPQRGLLGEYYNETVAGGITPAMTPPGSAQATPSTTANLVLTRMDQTLNYDWGQGSPAAAVTVENFYGVWTGKLRTPTVAGTTFQIGTITDDGVRVWVNNVMVRDDWTGQGPANLPEMSIDQTLAADTVYDIRVEYMEQGGGAVMKLYWLLPGAAAPEIISSPFLSPPDGPAAPGNFTAVATSNNATPQVVVNWTAPAGSPAATSYIVSRATVSGGPYTQVAVQTGTTFTDNTVVFNTAYYYVVQGTASTGLLVGTPTAQSASATPLPPAVTASPTTPLVTSEAGLDDTFTLTVNVVPSGAAANVRVTSSAPGEALVSGNGQGPAAFIDIVIPDGTAIGTAYVITVEGQDDLIADGLQNYNITFTVTGPATYGTTGISPIAGTNSDNDTPGITVTQISGPTTESAGTATFIVVFDTQPSVNTTMSVTSSNTAEATVSPANLTFVTTPSPDPNGWNTSHVVTITGADDPLLDFNQPFSISLSVTSGDAVYQAFTAGGPIVRTGVNLDNETIPTLEPVWGGGGGGCGLTGLEAGLLLGFAALLRRRRPLGK